MGVVALALGLALFPLAVPCKAGGDPDTNEGCRAYVDVLVDASFTLIDARPTADSYAT